MKKISKKTYEYQKNRNIKERLKSKKIANIEQHKKKYKIPKFQYRNVTKQHLLKRSRDAFRKSLYKKSKYHDSEITININKEIGIEKSETRDYFLNVAEGLLDTSSRYVKLNIEDCVRVWPSAVSMICSLVEWSEVAHKYNGASNRLVVESTQSKEEGVNDYLSRCGFSNYVKTSCKGLTHNYYKPDLVKIRRELTIDNIETREDEIVELIESFCDYDSDEIELFNGVVLTEIFNNVTEHGFSHRDMGWWILAQTHPSNAFISLCISDNGIGIRNSLATGPQKKQIKNLIRERTKNHGELIRLATEENISGALSASLKDKGIFSKKYERGARRGNGLRRIKDTCSELNIQLTILSHNAFLVYDSLGREIACGGRKRKVFAGTMYHLVIPMKRGIKK